MLFVIFLFDVPERESTGMSNREKLSQLDAVGTALLAPGTVCLLLALQWGGLTYAVRLALLPESYIVQHNGLLKSLWLAVEQSPYHCAVLSCGSIALWLRCCSSRLTQDGNVAFTYLSPAKHIVWILLGILYWFTTNDIQSVILEPFTLLLLSSPFTSHPSLSSVLGSAR
jgi:hypothetical protein